MQLVSWEKHQARYEQQQGMRMAPYSHHHHDLRHHHSQSRSTSKTWEAWKEQQALQQKREPSIISLLHAACSSHAPEVRAVCIGAASPSALAAYGSLQANQ